MAEFEWLNKQGVRSSKGFAVQFTGQYTIEYREGTQAMVFFCEDGVDPRTNKGALMVQVYPFPTWSGPTTQRRRLEILENLRRAIQFQGLVPFFQTDTGEEVQA